MEILLRAGLDVNIRSPAGTALHEAALCGKLEVVRTLLENGADLSIRDAHHFTVKDLLSQFPAQATHEIMGLLKSKFFLPTFSMFLNCFACQNLEDIIVTIIM